METDPLFIFNNNINNIELSDKTIEKNNETYFKVNTKNNNLLLNFSSIHTLKYLFLYVKYNTILNLIKYNKYLQNKLGMNIKNYKDYSDYKYIIKKREDKRKNSFVSCIRAMSAKCSYAIWATTSFIYSLFIIIYTIISIKFKIKLNNALNSFISIVNMSMVSLLIFIIISFCIIKKYIGHYDKMTKYHLNLILFFVWIYLLYEILILLKIFILLIHINAAFNWRYTFILFDILFLILNFLWIKLNYKENYQFFKNNMENLYNYYLIRYKNIPIKEYLILNDFKNNNNKTGYIRYIAHKFEYLYSNEDFNIISLINDFRIKNNLNELQIEYNIPNYIIDEPTPFILYNNQNIFQLSNDIYIFKYKLGLFIIEFLNNNREIINILINKNLNTINIITQGKIQYIILY